MNNLHIMMGCSGSGKSTVAKNIKDDNDKIVCMDVLREEFLGDVNDQSKNKQIFELAVQNIKLYSYNFNVIFDATNLKKKDRADLISRVKSYFNQIILLYVNVPIEVAKERNKQRERSVPEEVIEKQYTKINPPDLNEPVDTIIEVGEDGFAKSFTQLIELKKE